MSKKYFSIFFLKIFTKKRKVKSFIRIILVVFTVYIIALIYPNFLFTYKHQYRNFIIRSDKPITSNINVVIDDVIKRLEESELFETQDKFKLYLCNEDWRFRFFTRNKNAGGAVNFLLSPNIFIRKNDIEKNQVIPPHNWKNTLVDRPLSYFITHESVHSLQRGYNIFFTITTSVEIIEGYAEYIAKFKNNDIVNLIEELKNNSPAMNPKNGLYNKYNLYITYLIEKKGFNFEKIVNEKPELEKILREITEK